MVDLVIKGGTVIDGTGAPARTADVAITDGTIVAVGRVTDPAMRTVDADGLLVTPGFVDIHAHYDGQATWDERLIPSSWHGVTTVVAGNCGVGFAPVRPADHHKLIELMEGVEDIPGAALHEGLPWTWESFPEFLDALDQRRYDIDVATQVPHGALRLHVMGERGARREPATADDIAEMARLAREGVEAGALGFSTSRTMNHKTSTGEYTPTLTAEADELVGIAVEIGRTGAGVLQVVSDFADADAEFAIFKRMTVESGRPLSFSLAEARPGSHRRPLELLSEARAEGVPMSAQVAPRAVGLLLGLQCTLNPLLPNPVFRELTDQSVSAQARALEDPTFRLRLLDAHRAKGKVFGNFHQMYELGEPPDYEPDPATSLAARAAREGREPIELAIDILAANDGRSFIYIPLLNYAGGNLDVAGEMLAHPWTVPGLADGGAHVGTICDASFPTTLLAWWGRDRPRGTMDLPYLVQQHTRDTARVVGLVDRGVLAPGYRADANVIDFDNLALHRPEMRFDLPAGGKRLVQSAEGYVATIVAGEVTYEQGEAAGPLPGRLIRGAPRPPERRRADKTGGSR
jgi:N-acyl-D-aspartate/D-glutamate deacylase